MTRIGFSVALGLPGILSRLVCWATRSTASHCWLLVRDATLGADLVIEASEVGFRAEPLSTWSRSNRIVALYSPRWPVDDALPLAGSDLGRRYDYLGLLGMAWVELGLRLGRSWRNPWAERGALFCSEAVADVLRRAHYPGSAALRPGSTAPGDLLSLLAGDGSERWLP